MVTNIDVTRIFPEYGVDGLINTREIVLIDKSRMSLLDIEISQNGTDINNFLVVKADIYICSF